ncbi:MAG: RHS repeat-associated core domain-containing protein, partial [Solirubrobacteraceae bacterium MAG38_C4-C5]|nr:RHS repeat-associated core domain-containing protein [Candidatus Siliceabacter maunaloa]
HHNPDGIAVKVPRRSGQPLDSQTGHYKIGLRYYNPQLARWTQQDPLTGYMDPRRANPYIYAGQDPINQVDPTGASFLSDALSVGGDALGVGCATAGLFTGGVGLLACGVVSAGLSVAGTALDPNAFGVAGSGVGAAGFGCNLLPNTLARKGCGSITSKIGAGLGGAGVASG